MKKISKNYKHLIFDFDGTINDTSEGIYATFTAVLKRYGIDASKIDLNPHIGPPLTYSYNHLVGEANCAEAIELHRKTFVDINAVALSKPYEGAIELLDKLYNSGKYVMAIASCKLREHLVASLKLFNIDRYFTYVYAQTEQLQYKAEVLNALIDDNCIDRADCLMIGDTLNDIDGAVANGIDVVAVAYGFGKRDELERSPAVAICDSVDELEKLLLQD